MQSLDYRQTGATEVPAVRGIYHERSVLGIARIRHGRLLKLAADLWVIAVSATCHLPPGLPVRRVRSTYLELM